MIKIHPAEIPDREKEFFFEEVTKSRSKRYLRKIDELCQTFFKKSFKEMVWISPNEILDYAEKECIELGGDEEFTCIAPKNEGISRYMKNTLYGKMPQSARNFVLEWTKLSVCPYCNRNYISSYRTRNEIKGTYELDHFFPVSKYPMLAVSFYNLIPVCGACNLTKKEKDIGVYPYGEWDHSAIKFKYEMLKADYLSNKDSIVIKISHLDSMPQEWLEYLEGVYENHKEDAQIILNKKKYFGKGYLNSIRQSLRLEISEDKLKQYLFGNFVAENAEYRIPLSKLLRDIYDQ